MKNQKATFSQIAGSWLKAFISGILVFALLQYSHGNQFTDLRLWDVIGSGVGALLPFILKWAQGTDVWGQTFFGGLAKNALTIVIGLIVARLGEGSSLLTMDWPDLINTTIATSLPSVINWLNPNDPRYGVNKTETEKA
jgi:hypothetical protein